MKINIKSIIICIGLIIVYLLIHLKEKFNPDITSHDVNNIDYDKYMKVGYGIEANISDNSVSSSNTEINICNVCKKN